MKTGNLVRLKIAILLEYSEGGIADYAHSQATALAARGVEVEVLCTPAFLQGRPVSYMARAILSSKSPSRNVIFKFPFCRNIALARAILKNIKTLHRYTTQQKPDAVLLHFSEYLAPLWAWRLRRIRRNGINLYSVLHDPSRDYCVGPRWWHELSVRAAFSALTAVFVHTLEPISVPKDIKAVWIPHGLYAFPPATKSREAVRRELGLPTTAKVLIAFGYIRDNKNLDLVIGSLAELQDVYLLVAGADQAGGNRPLSSYVALAEQLGCNDRCRWVSNFISRQEVANLFSASDLAVVTYSKKFVSASGALAIAAWFQVPFIASSGSKTMEDMVERYRLGVWVEPDSMDAISAGLRSWLEEGVTPDWEAFAEANSWTRNAQLVHEAIVAVTGRNWTSGNAL